MPNFINKYRDECMEDTISAAYASPACYPWNGCSGNLNDGFYGATWPIYLNDDRPDAYYSRRNGDEQK